MKQIELISVGELKFKALKELEREYLKKIGFFIKVNSRSLRDVKIQDETQKRKKEGTLMMQSIAPKDYVIGLDEHGKKMDSVKFAKLLEDKLSYETDRVVFLIGGHSGLSKELDQRINLKLSFSEMTFAHDLFRILFLEQLYRAFTINKGIKYHR